MDELECRLFDSSVENICSLEEEMLKSLTNHVVSELKTGLKIYADNNQSMYVEYYRVRQRCMYRFQLISGCIYAYAS